VVAFFGIRGLGSFYYLAYGLNHGDFHRWDRLWAITGFVVLCSILVHGVTATPLMARIDAWRRREVLGEDKAQP
jgi:NhaP-type Na+/H+ or K+/H+ antiporter